MTRPDITRDGGGIIVYTDFVTSGIELLCIHFVNYSNNISINNSNDHVVATFNYGYIY